MLRDFAVAIFSSEVASVLAVLLPLLGLALLYLRYRHRYLLPHSLRRLRRLRDQLVAARYKELRAAIDLDIHSEAFRALSGLRCDAAHRELALRLHKMDPHNANWMMFRNWLNLLDLEASTPRWNRMARPLYIACLIGFWLCNIMAYGFVFLWAVMVMSGAASSPGLVYSAIILFFSLAAGMLVFTQVFPNPFGYQALDKLLRRINQP